MDFLPLLYVLSKPYLVMDKHIPPSLSYTEFLEKLSQQLTTEEATKTSPEVTCPNCGYAEGT